MFELRPGPNFRGEYVSGGVGLMVIIGLIFMFLSIFWPGLARRNFLTLLLCTWAVCFLVYLVFLLRRRRTPPDDLSILPREMKMERGAKRRPRRPFRR